MLHFLLHNGPRCQVETRSLRAFITLSLTASLSEMLGSPGPRGSCSNANILLPSISARCTLVWHHGEHSPCSPSRQPGRSTVQCQWQSVPPCAADGNSPPVAPFQCCPVNCPPLRGLPLEPTPRGSQPHRTTCYEVATVFPIQWSLRLFSLLGILPPLLMWSLRLLSLLGILLTTPIVLLFILFLTQLSCCSHCPHCSLNPG